jgi:hypothetical protein
VVLEILHRRRLAGRVGKTRFHQLAEDNILNLVEAYTVEDMVKKQVLYQANRKSLFLK